METAEILNQLERATETFPRGAVEAAVASRTEITPELLRILEDTVNRAEELGAGDDYMAHLYAMFLLAQFREVRAYPLVVRFASLPGDVLASLTGDFLTMDLGRVLASVCGGDLKGIQSVIEDRNADEWARGAALGGLVALVAAGQKSRDEIVGYFGALFRNKLEREWSHVWDALVAHAADLYPEELLDEIERAYEEGLVDPGFASPDDVKGELAMGKDKVLARLRENPHLRLVEDTVKEMGWWSCFQAASSRGKSATQKVLKHQEVKKPKTGRNEPCPCGSGKKYKRCCGA